MAPELNAWTEMAARTYGTYAGINDAIKKLRPLGGQVAGHASEIRQQMILMALIRAFAVMDRDANVSFQAVYRFMKLPNALDQIVECYAGAEPKSSIEKSRPTCRSAMDRFIEVYKTINFKSFGRLQSFRNTAIAHITMPDVKHAAVTHADVERLVRASCEMAGQLTLMLSGLNDWPVDHLDDAYHAAYGFWITAIEAQ